MIQSFSSATTSKFKGIRHANFSFFRVIKSTASAITGSLLVGQTSQPQDAANGTIRTGHHPGTKEKPYFVVRDDHKEVYAAGSTPLLPGNQEVGGTDDEGKNNYLSMPGYKSMMLGEEDMDQLRPTWKFLNNGSKGSGNNGATEKDSNHISFAKCLLLVYEKAINVQF